MSLRVTCWRYTYTGTFVEDRPPPMVMDRPISSYISVFGSLTGCVECTSPHRDTVNVLRFLNFRPQGLESPLGTSDTSITGTLDVERFCSSENRVRTLRMYSGIRNIGITQKALSLYHSIGKFPVENAAIGNEGRSRRRRRLSLSDIGVAVALNMRSGSEALLLAFRGRQRERATDSNSQRSGHIKLASRPNPIRTPTCWLLHDINALPFGQRPLT